MRGTPLVLRDFSAGVNLTESGSGYLQYAIDVEPMGQVGIKRRNGTTLVTALAVAPTVLHYSPATGWHYYLSNSTSNKVYYTADPTNPLFTEAGWETLAVADAPVTGGQGPVYMTATDATTPRYHTGGVVGNWTATTGSVPKSKILLYHNNRMFATSGSTLLASAPGDPRNWGTGVGQGWTVTLDLGADTINAVVPCGPYLIVFSDYRTYVVYDTETGANRVLSSTHGVPFVPGQTGGTHGAGASSHHAAVGADGLAYFASHDGAYVTDANTIRCISGAIPATTFNVVSSGAGVDLALYGRYLAVQVGSSMYLYDRTNESWWPHSLGGGAICTALSRSPFGREGISIARTALENWLPDHTPAMQGPTNVTDVSTATITPLVGQFVTPWQDWGVPAVRKRVRSVMVNAGGAFTSAAGFETYLKSYADSFASPTSHRLAVDGVTSLQANQREDLGAVIVNNLGLARRWAFGLSGGDLWRLDELQINSQYRKA